MGSLRALLRLWVKADEKRQVPARTGRTRRLCLESIEERRMLSAVPLDLSSLNEVGISFGTMSNPTSAFQSPRLVATTLIAGGTISFQDFYTSGIRPPLTPGEPPVFGIDPVLILIKNPTFMPKLPNDAAPPAISEQDKAANQGGAIPLETVGDESRRGDENTVTNQRATTPVIPKELQTALRSATSDAWRQTGGVTGEIAREIVFETEIVPSGRFAIRSPEVTRTTPDRNLNQHAVRTLVHDAAFDFLVGTTPDPGDNALRDGNVGAESQPLLTDTPVERDPEEDNSVPQSWLEKSLVDSVPAFLVAFAEPPMPGNTNSQQAPVFMDSAMTTNGPWVEHVQAVGRVFRDFGSRDGALELSGLLLAISLERSVAAERRRRDQAKTAVLLHKESH